MYPSATLNCYSTGWYLIRISPLSAGRTSVECEYYKHKDATNEEMEEFLSFGKQVQKEVSFSWKCSLTKIRTLICANNFSPISRSGFTQTEFCIPSVRLELVSIKIWSEATYSSILSLRKRRRNRSIQRREACTVQSRMRSFVRNRQSALLLMKAGSYLGKTGSEFNTSPSFFVFGRIAQHLLSRSSSI